MWKTALCLASLGASIFALQKLGRPHTVEFACDSNKYARKVLLDNFHINNVFTDCSSAEFKQKAPACDILKLGRPANHSVRRA